MKELVYTSARSGLRPGTTGFCTVAMSDGLPAAVVEFLERLSNIYRPVYMPYDPRAADNPVAVSLVRARPGGQPVAVLSRNAAAGTDHTGRTNNLAHHLVFDGTGPRDGSNPAAMAAQPGTFLPRWDDQPRRLPARAVAGSPGPRGVCRAWADLTGDPGWAATVAAAWADRSARPLYLIYPTGTNLLELLSEAASLLPADRRWDATFTTYYTGLPPEAVSVVRGVLAGTPQEAEARRADHVDLMDLVGPAPDGPFADRARGRVISDEVSPPVVVDAVPPPRKPASAPASRAEPVEATALVPLDEPPPAVQPVRLPQRFKSDRAEVAERRTGVRWGLIFAVLFGVWALLSTAAALVLAVGWAGARGNGEPTEPGQQAADPPPAGPEVGRREDEPKTSTAPKEPKGTESEAGALAQARSQLEALKKERDEVRKRTEEVEKDRDDLRKEAARERGRAEAAEKQLREGKGQLPKAVVVGDSLHKWFEHLSSKKDLDKLVAYQQTLLEWQEVKREIDNTLAAGEMEVRERDSPDQEKKKKGEKVYALAKLTYGDGKVMPVKEGRYSVIAWYLSEARAKSIAPSYLPKGDEAVQSANIRIRHQAGISEPDYLYIEAPDLPAPAREDKNGEKKLILVVRDRDTPGLTYLMWFKKKV